MEFLKLGDWETIWNEVSEVCYSIFKNLFSIMKEYAYICAHIHLYICMYTHIPGKFGKKI